MWCCFLLLYGYWHSLGGRGSGPSDCRKTYSGKGFGGRKSLAEFAPAGAKKMEIIFSGGVYVGENTARLANVRRVRRRRALRAMQRAAAFSNESPVKRVSFEGLSKNAFFDKPGAAPFSGFGGLTTVQTRASIMPIKTVGYVGI